MNNNIIDNMEGLFEFFNDSFFQSIILHLYNRIENSYYKQFVGDFLLTISSIYIYEFSHLNFVDKSSIDPNKYSQLTELRLNFLKYSYVSTSAHFNLKASDMGLNYNNTHVYDCVIYYNEKNNFLNTNFRTWLFYNSSNASKIFFGDVVYNCEMWLKGLLQNSAIDYYTDLSKLGKLIEDKIFAHFSENTVDVISYSSHKLFKKTNFSDKQRGFILNHYGFIKSVIYFEKFFDELREPIYYNGITFDVTRFFCKLKAICIENVFNLFKDEHSEIWKQFQDKVDCEYSAEFWRINRSCRRNIHYKDFVFQPYDTILKLDKQQDRYLNMFTKYIEDNLNFNISFLDKFMTKRSKELSSKISNMI